jgi:hypothetical protein
VDQEPVWVIVRQKLAELLSRPLGGGMRSQIRVENPPRADFHGDEDVEDTERSRHRNEKVTGDDRLCMIPYEG